MASEQYELEAGATSKIMFVNICRVCLGAGEIPIFGDDEKPDISKEVQSFGNIRVTCDDELPQHICNFCNELLQGAILFRNTAKKSEITVQIQKKIIEEENLYTNEDDPKSEMDSDNCISAVSKTKQKQKNEMLYICDKCGKVFHYRSSFTLHCKTHSGELKYKCMFCPYRGLHEGLLKIHIRTHTGDYNYKCTKCPASFITKSNLSKHLKKHLGPIDFKCVICNRGFYTKLDLERHNVADHLGVKNHICNICGKAFGYRNGMMNHQLKVHKREKLTKGKGRLPNYILAKINESLEK